MSKRDDKIATVLEAYGTAIRGDWGSIDGRSARAQFDEFAVIVRYSNDIDVGKVLLRTFGICPTHHCWYEQDYCDCRAEASDE